MTRFTSDLRGSVTALATPMCGERIDTAALARLALRQVQRGTAALVVCGSTGEAAALTDATADLSRPPRLRALCGPGLAQFTGDDATAAAHRAMGGAGCVSVTANLVPAMCVALHRAWDSGDRAGFARLRDVLDPLHQALFTQSNPIPLKAALAHLGLAENVLRLPLTRAAPATRARVLAALDGVIAEEERHAARLRLAVAV